MAKMRFNPSTPDARYSTLSFTLIEIILALLVIAVGIVSVMGLFPLSMRVHNEAMSESQIASMADEVTQLAMLRIKDGESFPNRSWVMSNLQTDGTWSEDPASVGELKYYLYNGQLITTSGLLRIHRTHDAKRDGTTVPVSDVDVVFGMWQENIEYVGIVSDGSYMSKTDGGVIRVTVEASWPAAVPYADRKTLTFVTEVNP